MNFSHRLQFFMSCSSMGVFRGMHSCRNRLLQTVPHRVPSPARNRVPPWTPLFTGTLVLAGVCRTAGFPWGHTLLQASPSPPRAAGASVLHPEPPWAAGAQQLLTEALASLSTKTLACKSNTRYYVSSILKVLFLYSNTLKILCDSCLGPGMFSGR